MNIKSRFEEDARKIILFILAFGFILAASTSSAEFLEVHNLQSFFQRITILCVLAIGMSFPFAAGLRDFSAIGIYLLSAAILERLRMTEWFLQQGTDFRLFVLSLFPIAFGIFSALWGVLLSRIEDRALFYSTGLTLLFGGLAFFLKPSLSPACEAWFCGDVLLGVQGVFLLVTPIIIFVSIAAIRYYWPRFTWILPATLVWIASTLLLFITYEYQGLPLGAVIACLSIFIFYIFTEHTRWGLGMIAWGAHREAARLSAIRPATVFLVAYFGLGFFSSLSSLMEFRTFEWQNFYQAADVSLLSWAALIIGGVALRTNRSTLNALLAGVIFVAGLEILWVTREWPMSLFFASLGLLVAVSASFKS